MSSILRTLHQMNALVYESVYGFGFNLHYIAEYLGQHSIHNPMSKRNFSIPKIYTGGVEITNWDSYTFEEQQKALKKDWYIYYSFRNPINSLLTRQNPIKGNANSYKTKKERYSYLSVMRSNLQKLLENGANPYVQNDFSYLDYFLNKKPIVDKIKVIKSTSKKPKLESETLVSKKVEEETVEKTVSIKEAFEITLSLKKNMMNDASFGNFQWRINKFTDYLPDTSKTITSIKKMDVVNYLNEILKNTSPRNRNNGRTALSSFFKELENNEFIKDNFVAKIPILKAIPERNKTYSDALLKDIFEYLQLTDKMLLLFVRFIFYGYLRPIEVCRLKVKDIDLVENKLHVRAKNQPVKIKIIPEILLKELPNLSLMNSDHYLFTPSGYAMECEKRKIIAGTFFPSDLTKLLKKNLD